MSAIRIIFIIVCIIVGGIVFTIGLVMRRDGDDSALTVTSLLSRTGRKRKKRPALRKNVSTYLTVVLALAAIVLLFVFSGR